MVIWIRYFRVNTYSIHIIKMTLSQLKVSMLICVIISLRWRAGAGVFRESCRIFRQLSPFLLPHITASVCKKRGIVHSIPIPLSLFRLSLAARLDTLISEALSFCSLPYDKSIIKTMIGTYATENASEAIAEAVSTTKHNDLCDTIKRLVQKKWKWLNAGYPA